MLPISDGLRALLYPSPLRYNAIPAFSHAANATILFASDTLLTG